MATGIVCKYGCLKSCICTKDCVNVKFPLTGESASDTIKLSKAFSDCANAKF